MNNILKHGNFISYIYIFYVIVCSTFSSEVLRPLGVSLSRRALYNPDRNFTCFDNSKTIPFIHVNDDYCDCPDASDEPGTSACPHGFFQCSNAGHKPLNLASSKVNDGICDCCDGTDEYNNPKVSCPNICLQLGQNARAEAQRLAELIKSGKQLKMQLTEQGTQLKQKRRNKLVDLQKSKEEAVRVKAEKEAIKDEIELVERQVLEKYRKIEEQEKQKKAEAEASKNKEEAIETFKKIDSNQDGVLELPELQSRQIFDKDRNGEVSDEEARYFLNGHDTIDLESFVSDAWPNIKPYQMMDAGIFKEAQQSSEREDEEEPNDEEEEEDEVQEEAEGNEDEEENYQTEEQDKTIQYDEETQKLVDQATAARNDFAEAENALKDIEKEMNDIEKYLERDYGPEEEFATLEGQCFDYTDHEYTYKLCPFDKTSQQSISGGAETRLGSWGTWGSQGSNYDLMIFDRGQSCWNGPQRSSRVKIFCGTDNKVTAVSEPNRCEYSFEFNTPAACREISVDIQEELHDEL